jgi:hypothetical protein
MMTRTPLRSGSAAICRVASSPSVPGMRMSIRTTIALVALAASLALPLAAATTTAAVAGLLVMHLTVGAATIPAMARSARVR